MRLCRFTHDDRTRFGKLAGDQVIDLSSIPGIGPSMRQLLTDLPSLRPVLEAAHTPH